MGGQSWSRREAGRAWIVVTLSLVGTTALGDALNAQAVDPPEADIQLEAFNLGRSDAGIGSLLALPSGSVIATIPRGAEIRILDPERDEVTVRKAELSEGRFFPHGLFWADGTVRALDFGPLWLAILDPDRTPDSVQDDEPIQVTDLRDGVATYSSVLGFTRDDRMIILASGERFGAALASTDVDPAVIPGAHPPIRTEPVWIHDRAGGGLDTLAVVSTLHKLFFLSVADPVAPDGSTRRRSSPVSQPFADSPLVAWDPEREHVVLLDRGVSEDPEPTPTYSVFRVNLEGDTVSVEHHPYEPIPMQPAWFDTAAREVGTTFEDVAEEGYRFALEHLFQPAWLPSVSLLVSGTDGTLWIAREVVPDATHRSWDVVTPEGERTHQFDLPSAIEILTAHGRQAWAVERGADTPGRIWRILLDSEP